MAPLGEWSLEATVLDEARGMPGTVASLNGASGRDIPNVARSPPTPRIRRRADSGLGGLGVQPAISHRIAVAFGQGAQLPQGKRASAAALRNHDAGPQPFGPR
jgi:hypothetical protein